DQQYRSAKLVDPWVSVPSLHRAHRGLRDSVLLVRHRNTEDRMKRMLVAGGFLPILAMMLVAAPRVAASPRAAAAQDVKKGQEVYTAQKCSMCHAIGGKGS